MSSPVPAVPTAGTSRPLPCEDQRIHPAQPLAKNQLDEVLHALAIPFDLQVVQWCVIEWSDDRARVLMMPYADPRAYSDRLNDQIPRILPSDASVIFETCEQILEVHASSWRTCGVLELQNCSPA